MALVICLSIAILLRNAYDCTGIYMVIVKDIFQTAKRINFNCVLEKIAEFCCVMFHPSLSIS